MTGGILTEILRKFAEDFLTGVADNSNFYKSGIVCNTYEETQNIRYWANWKGLLESSFRFVSPIELLVEILKTPDDVN